MSSYFVNGSAQIGNPPRRGQLADVNFLLFSLLADIIGCLVAGLILTVLFFFWNAYLSRAHAQGSSTAWWQPPPLIPGDLWFRANGRFLAILMIVLWTWCSFISNNFWVRTPPVILFIPPTERGTARWIELCGL